MKKFQLLIALIIVIGFISCKSTSFTNNVKTGKISNNHINIPGTRVFMIPPEGFHTKQGYTGLINDNSSYIQILDLVGTNFYYNVESFTKDALVAKGVKVYEFKDLKFNEYDSKYVVYSGSGLKLQTLIFGDSTFSTMLLCVYSELDKNLDKAINKALLSVNYDTTLVINPFENAIFTINTDSSKFKFENFSGGMYFFEPKEDNTIKDSSTILLIMPIPADESYSAAAIANAMQMKAMNNGMIFDEVLFKSDENFNGYEAYQAQIKGTLNDREIILYQLVIKDNDKCIVVQCIISNNFEENIKETEALTRTLKFSQSELDE